MSRETPPAIEASGLAKRFRDTTAVRDLTLRVPTGSVYALLGPNGAGKTTTVRMLATLLRPDGGMARVLGHDVVGEADALRRRISLTGQFASVDTDLTGSENLILIGRLLGLPPRLAQTRADILLEAFGLTDAASRRSGTYSGGMRRRLDLAASLVAAPDLLFLDEPTTGLDPHSRNQIWQLVESLAERGTTVLMTTQYLEEADRLADRIAVIDNGTLVAEGTSDELKASVGGATLRIRLRDADSHIEAHRILGAMVGISIHAEDDSRSISVSVPHPDVAATAVARLSDNEIGVDDFSLARPTLDEVFLALTGHRTDPDSPDDRKDQAA